MAVPSAKLHIFDFDGTLVHSAEAKRQAFHDVFPAAASQAVASVLTANPDGSRYELIPEMIARCGLPDLDAESLIGAYAKRTAELVRSAALVEGAEEALAWAASRGKAFVFSVTPHDQLCDEINWRGLGRYLSGVWGYPHRKPEVLARLLRESGSDPTKVLVIGDGISDAEAARLNGTRYLPAVPGWPKHLMVGALS